MTVDYFHLQAPLAVPDHWDAWQKQLELASAALEAFLDGRIAESLALDEVRRAQRLEAGARDAFRDWLSA